MAFEDVERVREYVHPDAVHNTLAATLLDEVDRPLAKAALLQGRAQFVVDAVTQELTSRYQTLAEQKASLLATVATMEADIDLIDQTLGRREKTDLDELYAEIELDQTPAKTYAALMQERKLSVKDIMTRAHNTKPFWLTASLTRHTSDYFSFQPWIDANGKQIKEELGLESTDSFTRMASCLARAQLPNTTDEQWLKRFGIEAIQQDSTTRNFLVAEPSKFADMALAITNFGVRSMAAVLCMAAMQREERFDTETK